MPTLTENTSSGAMADTRISHPESTKVHTAVYCTHSRILVAAVGQTLLRTYLSGKFQSAYEEMHGVSYLLK